MAADTNLVSTVDLRVPCPFPLPALKAGADSTTEPKIIPYVASLPHSPGKIIEGACRGW